MSSSDSYLKALAAHLEQGNPLEAVRQERERRRKRRIDTFFLDDGPLGREHYPRHLEFFAAGAVHRERLFMAGNRCGKTTAGAYEVALHLTGVYPHWWKGRRFDAPVQVWVAGEKSDTTRDIVQLELLGKWGDFGTGMVPGEALIDFTPRGKPAHAVDTAFVRHVTGAVSSLGFKSYREGAAAFQGTAKHVIWFDEEPDLATYTEANMRTMIVPGAPAGGIMIVTFTPLNGWSDVVESFLGGAEVI